MLDRLPTELLLRTLELAAPLHYSPSFYVERRLLLRNCCLVSRRLCEVAQPLLPEVYEVAQTRDMALLEKDNEGKKMGSLVRLLILQGSKTNPLSGQVDLQRALSYTLEITELRIIHVGDFDLSWLNSRSGALSCLPFSSRE
jgi:hypothetical protein